jgi:hypothetical protein
MLRPYDAIAHSASVMPPQTTIAHKTIFPSRQNVGRGPRSCADALQ